MYHYINYKDYAVDFDEKSESFTIFHEKYGAIVRDLRFRMQFTDLNYAYLGERTLKNYPVRASTLEKHLDSNCLALSFMGEDPMMRFFTLRFTLSSGGVKITADVNAEKNYRFFWSGELLWGDGTAENTYAMRRRRKNDHLRASIGNAASPFDDMLFDKLSDHALCIEDVEKPHLAYDEEKSLWRFEAVYEGDEPVRLGFSTEEALYEREYNVHYAPAKKRGKYTRPPVGFMTWYAVKFDASEKSVLENAAVQAEKLKDYGADTIWVDWEWYHTGFDHFETDCDTLHPLPSAYPNGMRPVSDKIRELGFTPAIWIGATHEVRMTDYLREHPDALLAEHMSWCGPYFFDLTNKDYLENYIPRVFNMLTKEWGYDAIKWDCLPKTLDILDMYHDRFADPTQSSEKALRAVIQKARDTVGEEVYMLSCSGEGIRDTTMYGDIFDAARIGADIFSWRDFRLNCVDRLFLLYPYHNVTQLCDPDNVVVREEFNTMDQARSRASLVALAGTPLTFGDDLRELPEERMEILQRIVPSMDVHTEDFETAEAKGDFVLLDLNLSAAGESYKVIDLFNMAERPNERILSMEEIELEPEEDYLVYDFWRQQFLGRVKNNLKLDFRPHESRVLAVRPVTGRPQVVSTSRHVSQGAVDILKCTWNEADLTLSGTSSVVKNDPYRVTFYAPDGYRPMEDAEKINDGGYVLTIRPEKTGEIEWKVAFEKE